MGIDLAVIVCQCNVYWLQVNAHEQKLTDRGRCVDGA